MKDALTKIIPIILLLLFGFYLQRKKLADQKTMDAVKKGIVNIALPLVLFLAFLRMELKKEFFALSAVFFFLMLAFLLVGEVLNKSKRLHHLTLLF